MASQIIAVSQLPTSDDAVLPERQERWQLRAAPCQPQCPSASLHPAQSAHANPTMTPGASHQGDARVARRCVTGEGPLDPRSSAVLQSWPRDTLPEAASPPFPKANPPTFKTRFSSRRDHQSPLSRAIPHEGAKLDYGTGPFRATRPQVPGTFGWLAGGWSLALSVGDPADGPWHFWSVR